MTIARKEKSPNQVAQENLERLDGAIRQLEGYTALAKSDPWQPVRVRLEDDRESLVAMLATEENPNKLLKVSGTLLGLGKVLAIIKDHGEDLTRLLVQREAVLEELKEE